MATISPTFHSSHYHSLGRNNEKTRKIALLWQLKSIALLYDKRSALNKQQKRNWASENEYRKVINSQISPRLYLLYRLSEVFFIHTYTNGTSLEHFVHFIDERNWSDN